MLIKNSTPRPPSAEGRLATIHISSLGAFPPSQLSQEYPRRRHLTLGSRVLVLDDPTVSQVSRDPARRGLTVLLHTGELAVIYYGGVSASETHRSREPISHVMVTHHWITLDDSTSRTLDGDQ